MSTCHSIKLASALPSLLKGLKVVSQTLSSTTPSSSKMTQSSYSNGSFQSKGNQIVHVKIDIPKKITTRQEEQMGEIDAESEKSSRGISGRVADAAEGQENGCKYEDSHDKEEEKTAQ